MPKDVGRLKVAKSFTLYLLNKYEDDDDHKFNSSTLSRLAVQLVKNVPQNKQKEFFGDQWNSIMATLGVPEKEVSFSFDNLKTTDSHQISSLEVGGAGKKLRLKSQLPSA